MTEYFDIIQKYLKVNGEMRFSEWTVDTQPDDVGDNVGAVVTTRGQAEFEYVSTGKRCVALLYVALKPSVLVDASMLMLITVDHVT